MKQRALVENTCIILLKQGYAVKSLARSCFDIIARKCDKIILLKIVEDANSLRKESVNEMLRVSEYLQGTPLIIAEKASTPLEDGIIYSRQGVYTLTPETMDKCLTGRMPFIKSGAAGMTLKINSTMLQKRRDEEGYSLNDLATKIGVSKKMIQRYEKGDSEILVNKAARMRECLGTSVFKRIDILSENPAKASPLKSRNAISDKYSNLGFRAEETKKSPFNIIAKKDREIVLTSIGDKISPHAKKVSELISADSLAIYRNKKPKDMPSMKKEEFLELEKAKALIKFLREF